MVDFFPIFCLLKEDECNGWFTYKKDITMEKIDNAIFQTTKRLKELVILKQEVEKEKKFLSRIK
jgi:hypothetical protein